MEVDTRDRIIELRERSGMTRKEFSEYFGIPLYTLRNWELGKSKIPGYWIRLMEYRLMIEKKIVPQQTDEEKTENEE